MAAGTVPVTLKRLGVEGNGDTKVLSNTVKKVAREGQLVAHRDTRAGTNLVLPLRGHDLSVNTRDLNASVETSLVVSLDNVTAVNLTVTDTAVVRALGRGEATSGPAVGVSKVIKKGVLLLNAKPNISIGVSIHELGALVSVVRAIGGTIRVVALSKNNNVVTESERIGVNGNGSEVDIRVVAGGLLGRGAVKVPLGEVGGAGGLLIKSLTFGSDVVGTVNPDVLSHDSSLLRKAKVLLENRCVGSHYVCIAKMDEGRKR
jgi:hypothetical protein